MRAKILSLALAALVGGAVFVVLDARGGGARAYADAEVRGGAEGEPPDIAAARFEGALLQAPSVRGASAVPLETTKGLRLRIEVEADTASAAVSALRRGAEAFSERGEDMQVGLTRPAVALDEVTLEGPDLTSASAGALFGVLLGAVAFLPRRGRGLVLGLVGGLAGLWQAAHSPPHWLGRAVVQARAAGAPNTKSARERIVRAVAYQVRHGQLPVGVGFDVRGPAPSGRLELVARGGAADDVRTVLDAAHGFACGPGQVSARRLLGPDVRAADHRGRRVPFVLFGVLVGALLAHVRWPTRGAPPP